ncbi:MAG: HAMP domain-containing histidine kinase, partial [Anaerolineae bacterium]|nr:HAMP domain-containing histidine kinase [Anaerolineae bacterium]
QRFEVQGQWFEGVGALVLTATSEEVGVVVSMRDVTDEVLTERMRTAFIAQISHELRTPLAAVKGFVDLAQYVLTEANEQARGFLVTAVENINVLNRLINEILDVSQLVRGDLQLRVEQADINAILVEVADGFSEVIADKRLDFQTDYGDLPEIAGDPDRLRWALSQVVKNACNYTLPGGMVRVTTARENGSVVIRVRDNGVGITPRELPRIFEQFYRGFPTSTDGQLIDVRGAGLGLFILDQVVSAHGGSVAVQSAPGRGSEFAVRLPVSEG